MKRMLTTLAIVWGITFSLSACQSAEPIELGADAVIIDVRTPEEYSAGHLDGAINIDVQSPEFAEQIMALDKDGEYFVYCRSGNRSGQAIAQMAQMGFSEMVNGGSVEEASSATGLEVVTN